MSRESGTQSPAERMLSRTSQPSNTWSLTHQNVKKRQNGAQTKKLALARGTTVKIEWSLQDGWPFGRPVDYHAQPFLAIVEGFALFNPHATITLNWFGTTTTWKATSTDWPKWKPDRPTSSHWYEASHLERLIGAYITHDREQGEDRLVSDFLAEFDGLSGSQKRAKVLDDTDLCRVPLSKLVVRDRLDTERIAALLLSMQSHTRAVKSKTLGVIGEEHFRERLLAMGVVPESFNYSKKLGKDGLPYVVEAAFGWLGDESEDERRIYSGVKLEHGDQEPVSLVRHHWRGPGGRADRPEGRRVGADRLRDPLSTPASRVHRSWQERFSFRRAQLMSISTSDIMSVTKSVTKKWTKQRKAEERNSRARSQREYVYSDRVNFTDVAEDILPDAYERASEGGKYPLAKRQLYYECRDDFLSRTGREITYDTFGRVLLKYMNLEPATDSWRVTKDPRGNFTIPNTERELRVPCGTIDIDRYLRRIQKI